MTAWTLAGLVVVMAACGSDKPPVSLGTDQGESWDSALPDTSGDGQGIDRPAPDRIGSDVPFGDLPFIPEAAGSDADSWAEGDFSLAGQPGAACQSASDCDSGWCIMTGDGPQCTLECVEECPFGWLCEQHGPSRPDLVYICVPPLLSLCRPCATNSDCAVNGVQGGAACVQYGAAGSYCGASCDGQPCPDGYACSAATDSSGAASMQCIIAAGECACNQWFADQGASTACFIANDAGSCPGTRGCTAEGLTPCSASIPEAETCNGADDDCDGSVDEGTGGSPCTISNDFGACPGTELCTDGQLVCSGSPAEQETCDALDNDCDGLADDGFPDGDDDGLADCVDDDWDGDAVGNEGDNCPKVANPGQEDLDDDKVGDACDPDADGDGIPDGLDNCDGLFNPGQKDLDADGLGDPCDGDVDGDGKLDGEDNCPLVTNADQLDSDNDGLGDACDGDQDGDGVPDTEDCAPKNPYVSGNALEVCDGLDNNCNLAIDEGFKDFDKDGLKDCVDPDDDDDGDEDLADCAPENPAVFHGATEICNALDDDCNQVPDDGLGTLACGKGACFHVVEACVGGLSQWCDPFDGIAFETCDAVDNDCDGLTDEDQGTTTCGLGLCSHTVPNCLDGKPLACDPMAGIEPEACDGQDNDCDGLVDEELGSTTCGLGVCVHAQPNCMAGQPQTCNPEQGMQQETCDGLDNDCDGQADEELGELECGLGICKHTAAACKGGKPQLCNPLEGISPESCDGLDNDCDGLVDEELGSTTCGLGVCEHSQLNCKEGQPVACDPLLGAQDESCDGEDNDCDGAADEEGAQGCASWYADLDGDGFGAGDQRCLCGAQGSYSTQVPGDCDDSNDEINPDAAEFCKNGEDDDCDGLVDEDCPYASCMEILALGKSNGSGSYTLDPDAGGPVQPFSAWCDMETDGGGWTLIVRVNGADGQNLLYDKWTSLAVLGDTADFSLLAGSDVLYPAYATVGGEELLFYDATVKCGDDYRLLQSVAFMGGKSLRTVLADLPPKSCEYFVCDPPAGPNIINTKFRNTGCTQPFNSYWGGAKVVMFADHKFGINISMWGSELLRFTNCANDYDAGFGSLGPADGGYNTGDLDPLVDSHSGWPGHVVTIFVR